MNWLPQQRECQWQIGDKPKGICNTKCFSLVCEVGGKKLEGRATTSRTLNMCFLRILGLILLTEWGLEQVRVKS